MTWYDGGLRPATPEGLDPNDPKQRLGEGGNGILFIGDKGMITCAGWAGMPRLLPLSLHREYKRPEKTLPRVRGHHADWLAACKGGPPASGNFEYSARLTELVLLGSVAMRTKKQLEWDGAERARPPTPPRRSRSSRNRAARAGKSADSRCVVPAAGRGRCVRALWTLVPRKSLQSVSSADAVRISRFSFPASRAPLWRAI